MKSHEQIETYAWLLQKMIDPIGIPVLRCIRVPSNELSSASKYSLEGKAPWNQANIIHLPTQQGARQSECF